MCKLDDNKFVIGLVMVVLFSLIQNSAIIYVYFAVLFLLELFYMTQRKNDRIVQQILMSIPLMGISVVGGIPLGNIYIALFSIYLLFIYRRVSIGKTKFLIYIIFVFSDALRLCLFSGLELSVIGIISVPILYLCIFAGIVSFEKTNKEQIMRVYIPSFIEGVILSIVYGAIIRFKSGGIANVFVNTSIVNRNEGASGDPNYFGLYICIAVSMLILIMIIEKKYSVKYFFGSCILLIMGLSSSSRMFYINAFILLCVLALILIIHVFDKKIFTTVIIIVILAIGLHFVKDMLVNNFDYVLTRLDTTNISELTNGRSDLIQSYLKYTNDNLFRTVFGIGIAQYNIRSGIGAYAHNMYLELYVTMGIIGVLTTCVFIVKYVFFNAFHYKNICRYIPAIIVAISGAAVNFLEVDCFYMLLGLIIAILKIENREETIIV